MKPFALGALLGAALMGSVSAPATAQAQAGGVAAPAQTAPSSAGDMKPDMAEGEIRKVDKGSAKITIRHGEIKNLDMPPMTMVFQAKEPALLDKAKVGDKIRFKAELVGGAYVVTAIEPAK